jgi:uncharacterized protein (DUF58 family)
MVTFDDTTLRKLEQLSLVAERVQMGILKGDRRSRKHGSSVEFADFRNYSPGDDLRQLDWNIYARLGKPFIRLLEEEEDLSVHMLLDSSASMDWPEGTSDTNKYRYACQLAAALGYIALAGGDRLTVSLLAEKSFRSWGAYRGSQNIMRLLEFLEMTPPGGIFDLNLALHNFAVRGNRPGLLFLMSDLFFAGGFKKGLNAILAKGHEVSLIHLLSPDEVVPPIGGDVKLIDVESGMDTEISLDSTTLDFYSHRLERWKSDIASYCGHRGIHYIPVITKLPWERLILHSLRTQRIVK